MIKRILKETGLDILSIFLIVGVGISLIIRISTELIIFPILLGLLLFGKPYVKIRLIMDEEHKAKTKDGGVFTYPR